MQGAGILRLQSGGSGMVLAKSSSKQGTEPTRPIRGAPLHRASSRRTAVDRRRLEVRILRTARRWEIWIFGNGRRLRCVGLIGVALANDALWRGQDLIDSIVERALREMERGGRSSKSVLTRRPANALADLRC